MTEKDIKVKGEVKEEPSKEEEPKEKKKEEVPSEEPDKPEKEDSKPKEKPKKDDPKKKEEKKPEEQKLDTTSKAGILKEIVNICGTIVTDLKIKITKDKLSMTAVDAAHVAMITIDIKKEAFEEYHATDFDIAIDLTKMADVLKLASGNDDVRMYFDEDSNRLVFVIDNLTRKMALVDTEGLPDPKIPNLELPGKVIIPTSELAKALKASASLTDHISITVDKEKLTLFAEGDVDTVDLVLLKEDLLDLEADEKYRSIYSIDYLSYILKGKASEILFRLGTDNPLKAEYQFADGNGEVMFLIAPRIESE